MCLQLGNKWRDLPTNVDNLHQTISSHLNLKEKIECDELIYYCESHKSGILGNPAMFKVNKNSHDKRLVNLYSLLTGL